MLSILLEPAVYGKAMGGPPAPAEDCEILARWLDAAGCLSVMSEKWFRDLDSNQDTQLQRLMSYQLDDPGSAVRSLAEESKGASRRRGNKETGRQRIWRRWQALCAGRPFLLN